MIDPNSTNRSAMLIGGGILMIIFGGILTFYNFVVALPARIGGNPTPYILIAVSLLIMLGGMVMIGAATFGGLAKTRKQSSTAVRQSLPGALVIARFAVDKRNEMIFDPELILEDFPLYVQLQFPDGRKGEFKTQAELWNQCIEGMKGLATIQGDWLGSFVPERPLR